jgi:C1A family cysteine protease
MKKYLVGLLCFCAFITNVSAARIQLKECEYTDEYIKYMRSSSAEKKKYIIIPPKCKDTSKNMFNRVGTSIDGASINDSSFSLVEKNLVTSVKDQGETEACWAQSTNASIESNLLVKNLGEYDLSEGHMELATQKTIDYGRPTFNREINRGGQFLVSGAYIMSGYGPVKEEYLPYETLVKVIHNEQTLENSYITNTKPVVDVNDIVYITSNDGCNANVTKDIKEYLITNGAIAATIYLKNDYNVYQYYDGQAYQDGNYNSDNTPKVIEANRPVNHAVTIVGWDDTISKDLFAYGEKPSRDGAWIVKNSYGTEVVLDTLANFKTKVFEEDMATILEAGYNSAEEIPDDYITNYLSAFYSNQYKFEKDQFYSDGTNFIVKVGNEGYHYISYDDIRICGYLAGFFNTDKTISDNSYDNSSLGLSNTKYETNSKVLYEATIFTKKNSGNEKLNEVSTFFSEVGQKYEIYFNNGQDIKLTKKIAEGVVNHIGYAKVKISNPPIISKEKFTVVIKLESDENVNFALLKKDTDVDSYFYNINLPKGINYLSLNGTDFTDVVTAKDYTFLTKAYTTNTTETAPEDEPVVVNPPQEDPVNPPQDEPVIDPGGEVDIIPSDEPFEDNPTDTGDIVYIDEPADSPFTGVAGLSIAIIAMGIILIVALRYVNRNNKLNNI